MSMTPFSTLSNLTLESPYDTSLSFLYKQAIQMGVPLRFLLIHLNSRQAQIITFFNLETDRDVQFITLFEFIKQLVLEDNNITITQIWEIIAKFNYNPLELVPVWLHAIPEYRVENAALLDQVNVFMSNLGEPIRYASMAEVINNYEEKWLTQYEKEYQYDLKTLQQYVNAQSEIAQIEPLAHSGLIVDSVIVTYDYPVAEGVDPLPDIFNSAINSYLVPFIQYNIKAIKGNTDDIKRFYKVYKGKSVDTRPDYNNVVLLSDQTSRANTIYLNVWQGTDYYDPSLEDEAEEAYDDAKNGAKGGFGSVSISLIVGKENGSPTLIRVKFKSPQTEDVSPQTIINRIHRHVPMLTLPGVPAPETDSLTGAPQNVREVQISGMFSVYQTLISEVPFFDLIMNDALFSSYLYLEESGKSLAEKTRLNIHYRGVSTELNPSEQGGKNKSSVAATLNEEVLPAGQKFYVSGYDQEYTVGPGNLQIVNVKITRSSSRKVAEQFMDVLTRLFRRYHERADEILQKYYRLIPEARLLVQAKTQPTPNSKTSFQAAIRSIDQGATLVKQLQSIAPDIFASGWARSCQPVSRQPKPIAYEEIPLWQNRMIQTTQGPLARQVMSFPKDNPRIYLVCPDDNNPYPGVIVNKKANREMYPYLPCCFKENELTRPNSALNKYLRDENYVAAKQTASAHIMKSDKILDPDRIGHIHTEVSSFLLQQYSEEGDISQFFRYGVPRSYNSFIHCVALAMGTSDYLNAPDREEWVSQFRENLFDITFASPQMRGGFKEKLLPETLRQELYDMANTDIITKATDNDDFFDPLLYYRALEIIFDCNIYVFAQTDQEHQTGFKTSLLKLPRHKYFYSHPPTPGKPVVLILRHWGPKDATLKYPQCEIIIQGEMVNKRVENRIMQFDDFMNTRLYPVLSFVARTISWQIYESNSTPVLTARLNIYSAVNYNLLFGYIRITGQIIDNAGKARMFELAPEYDPDSNTFTSLRIYVNVLPTAPLNVPQFNVLDASRNLPAYEKTIELFGDPISATVSTDQKYLTGLWFPMGDIQFGFYCPCKTSLWEEFFAKYPNINTNSEMAALTINIPRMQQLGESPVQRIRYLRRTAQFIDQIIKYLYLLAGSPDNIMNWLATFSTLLGEPRPDSVQLYQVTQLPRILPAPMPDEDAVSSVLRQLSALVPNMFYAGKFLIYDPQMLEGLVYQLIRFRKNFEGLNIAPVSLRQLQDYYDQKDDFQFNTESEFILGSLKEFKIWQEEYVPSPSLPQRTIQTLKRSIQTKLNPNAFAYQEPYIYQRSTNGTSESSLDPRMDKFYLIQNVAGGEFRRAVQVAYTWFQDKRNTGFTTDPYEGVTVPEPRTGEPLAIEAPVVEGDTAIMQDAPGGESLVITSAPPPTIGGITPVSGASPSGMSTVPNQPGPQISTQRSSIDVAQLMPAHIIYRISPGGGIIVDQNNSDQELTNKDLLALEILDYGNNYYAAMLPIL